MAPVLVIVRLLLAAVFALAAAAKLADRRGSRRSMEDFGMPARIAGAAGVLLPAVELAVAFALVPARTAMLGATGALVLLLTFIAGIARALARGSEPDCHCFGQLHSAPAGWPTLYRNAVLAAGAAFVVAAGAAGDPGPSAVGALDGVSTTGAVAGALGATTLAAVAAFAALLLRHGRLLVRVDMLEHALAGPGVAPEPDRGVRVGSAVPAFALPDLDGATITSTALIGRGTAMLLLFMEQGCGPCRELLPEVEGWQGEHRGRLQIVVVTSGDRGANRTYAGFHGLDRVLFQDDREVARAFAVSGTPSAVLIDADGRVASDVAAGADAIRALVAGPAAPFEVVQVPARSRRAATASGAAAAPARR